MLALPSLRRIQPYLRIVRGAMGLGGAALLLFHGWLFANQVAAGRLTDPGLVLRWLLAFGLAAGLVGIYRSGGSLWSRRATAMWVLAAVLHGPAIVSASAHSNVSLALPEAVATVVVQIAAASGSLALGLWILDRLIAAAAEHARTRRSAILAPLRVFSDPHRRPFSPRPPPRF